MPSSFKALFLGLAMMFIGFFWGIQDVRLKMSGCKVTATITDATEYSNRIQVGYMFSDENGLDHSGVYNAGKDWHPPLDMKVQVIHMPGKPESVKLVSEAGFTGVYIFLAGLAVTVIGYFAFNKESVVDAHRQTQEDQDEGTNPEDQLKRAMGLRRFR